MSQSTEKRMRRAWRNRMKATAGADWEKFMQLTERRIIKYHRIIVGLSILSAVLATLAVWGWM